MAASPLWCGLGNIHGLVLDGKPYSYGKASAQIPAVPSVSDVRITPSTYCACSLTFFMRGSGSLVIT